MLKLTYRRAHLISVSVNVIVFSIIVIPWGTFDRVVIAIVLTFTKFI
jgi:hypothetical protein